MGGGFNSLFPLWPNSGPNVRVTAGVDSRETPQICAYAGLSSSCVVRRRDRRRGFPSRRSRVRDPSSALTKPPQREVSALREEGRPPGRASKSPLERPGDRIEAQGAGARLGSTDLLRMRGASASRSARRNTRMGEHQQPEDRDWPNHCFQDHTDAVHEPPLAPFRPSCLLDSQYLRLPTRFGLIEMVRTGEIATSRGRGET